MRRNSKKVLYEKIMRNVSKQVKKALFEEKITPEKRDSLIRKILLNGNGYFMDSDEDRVIGTYYDGELGFFSIYSEKLNYTYCNVESQDIDNVRKQLEEEGYTFTEEELRNGLIYVSMNGEYKNHKFIPDFKPNPEPKEKRINPNRDPVGYYVDRMFTTSKDGHLW